MFPSLEQFAKTHKDHLQSWKEEGEFETGILLQYKTQQAPSEGNNNCLSRLCRSLSN